MEQKLEDVLHLLEESESPVSTNQVAELLDVDWHTADKRLRKLEEMGKVSVRKFKSNLKIWSDKDIPI